MTSDRTHPHFHSTGSNAKRPLQLGRLLARHVMTTPAVACRDEAYFEEIAEILADRDISGMPVVDASGDVIGVISERDLAYALGGPMVRLAVRRHNHDASTDLFAQVPRAVRRATDIMTAPALTVALDCDLVEIARLMRVHQVNRLPVLDEDRLVGVVTRGDVLGAIAHLDHAMIYPQFPPVVVGSEGMQRGSLLYPAGLDLQSVRPHAGTGE